MDSEEEWDAEGLDNYDWEEDVEFIEARSVQREDKPESKRQRTTEAALAQQED